ncbi:MAG: hypothetical protein KatS3mg130_0067 [Candidatus Sumerlaea sp.]|uniref:RNA-binding protein KhpB n=1 Tax=Sumerlaea chitinivorans TaxID=2250252 RepID=A0A2Z4Y893_SUMC1|nr:RNA-binding protein Jag [Candidatus Sumerlaea chitinivorans]MCX7963867.1 KH domain-containing protein [Candidatus Sumerlaea chitinivorans]GIX43659.1 MAG: hypothetical protein KatS3mg130_0067 [Candidatus Sumerlaea sp.]
MNDELKIPDLTISANTYEEAVAEGMRQLGVPADAVEIEQLEEAHDDTLPGAEPLPGVTVRFRIKMDVLLDHAKRHLERILELMGIEAHVEALTKRRGLTLNIISKGDGSLIIGKNGQNLDALQYVLNRIVMKGGREIVPLIVDSENYRERHYTKLEELARRTAKRVVRTGREIALKPMPPSDRKIIHLALRGFRGVHTISRGEEGNRRVVITPEQGAPPPKGVIRGRRPMRRNDPRSRGSHEGRREFQQSSGQPARNGTADSESGGENPSPDSPSQPNS